MFRLYFKRLSQIQRQFDPVYLWDQLFRGQLVLSSETTRISQSMREPVPMNSRDTRNRLATFLSSEPCSAGAFHVQYSEDSSINYILGQRYGGQDRKKVREFGSSRNKFQRISSRWLAGHQGCYVCGKNQKAYRRHSKEDVTEAIARIKKRSPSEVVTVDDLAMIVNELAVDNQSENDDDQDIPFSEEEDDKKRMK